MIYNHYHSEQFIYKGWLIMINKAGATRTVSVNIFPNIDLEKVKLLQRTNKSEYDKINQFLGENRHHYTCQVSSNVNPNYESIKGNARNYIDKLLGSLVG